MHPLLINELHSALKIPTQDHKNSVYLVLRALPVFGRKSIDGNIANADIGAVLRHLLERNHSLLVPRFTRQPASRRPSAVAVHNERNMAEAAFTYKRGALGEQLIAYPV